MDTTTSRTRPSGESCADAFAPVFDRLARIESKLDADFRARMLRYGILTPMAPASGQDD